MRTCRSLRQLVPLLLPYPPGALSECLENRVELHFDRSVVTQNGRNLSRDAEQLVDGHLRDPNRVLNREHHVFGNLDKLTDERQVLGRRGTGGGRSPLARGMNMLVMSGSREGMQIVFEKVDSTPKLRWPHSSRRISALVHCDIGLPTKSPIRSGCCA
jgi:hypothetical protein